MDIGQVLNSPWHRKQGLWSVIKEQFVCSPGMWTLGELVSLILNACSSISQGLYFSIAGFHQQVLYFLEKLMSCGTYGMLHIQQSTLLDTVLLLSTSLLMQVSAAYSTTVMEVTVLSWPLSILRYCRVRL